MIAVFALRRSFLLVALIGAALLLRGAAPVAAASYHFGARAGLTSEPDSIVVGGHVSIDELFTDLEGLRLEPSLELGFGDRELAFVNDVDYTTVRLSGDVKYEVPIGDGESLHIFPLAGISWYRLALRDCPLVPDLAIDCSDSEVGLSLGGGISHRGFAVQAAAGIGDLPELTITASYTFGR